MAALPGRTVAQGNPISSDHQIDPGLLGDWMEEKEGLIEGAVTDAAAAQTGIVALDGQVSDIDTRVGFLEAGGLNGKITVATWTDLLALSGTTDGEGAEVLDSDAGTHSAASGTGYDGSTVNNAGRYSWNDSWSRWVRIGDTGLTSKADASDVTYQEDRLLLMEKNVGELVVPLDHALSTPVAHTSITNWSTRVSESRSGGALTITQSHVSPLIWGPSLFQPELDSYAGRVFRATMDIDANPTTTGVGVSAVPRANADGSFPTDSSCFAWVLRQDGFLLRYTDNGSSSASSSTVLASGLSWDTADQVVVTAEIHSGGGALLTWTVDGVVIYQTEATAGQWPETWVPAAAVYAGGASVAVTFSELALVRQSLSSGAVASPYVSSAASPGGNGTEAAPYQSIDDAISSVDVTADAAVITLKTGFLDITSPLSFSGDRWRDLRIRSETGGRATIRAARVVDTWTAGSEAGVWYAPHYYGGVASISAEGGVTRFDDDRLDGVPIRAYKRLTPNSGEATLAAETIPACYVDTSAGRMYVYLQGDDPNDFDLRITQTPTLIDMSVPTGFKAARVELEGIRLQGGYVAGLRALEWTLDMHDVGVAGATLDGFALDECLTRMVGGSAFGCGNDGVNMDPSGGPGLDDPVGLTAWDFVARGCTGDGLSNHAGGGYIHLHGGILSDMGKDGLSMGQGGSILGTLIANCAQGGVTLYDAGEVDIRAADIRDCTAGVLVTRSAGTEQSLARINGGSITDGDRGVYVINSTGTASLARAEVYGVAMGGQNVAATVNSSGQLVRPAVSLS